MEKTMTYTAENVTVEVERVFTGEKTKKELILELIQKRYQTELLRVRPGPAGIIS